LENELAQFKANNRDKYRDLVQRVNSLGPSLSGGALRARSRTLSKQGIKKPMSHTMPLLWTRIPEPKLKNTVWGSISAEAVQFNSEELEKLFGAQPDIIPAQRVVEIGKVRINFKFNCDLDEFLKLYTLTDEQIRDAILTLDESVLPHAVVQNLVKVIPNRDEVEVLRKLKGSKSSNLRRADHFYISVTKDEYSYLTVSLLRYQSLNFDLNAGLPSKLCLQDLIASDRYSKLFIELTQN
jgi:hypothetical protein